MNTYSKQNKMKYNLGYTCLMTAAEFGQADIIQILLDHGANIEARNEKG